ncbi:MAG: hypothetical protein AMXMBFR4_01930 [Candidatus Hydrogenedentota bacterium]
MPNAVHVREMEEALAAFPWMDPHTHLDAAHLSARGLDDILLYHLCVSELYAAGCPNGARVPEDRTEEEAERRIVEAAPFLPKGRNTAMAWGIRIILRDLYGWDEPAACSATPPASFSVCGPARTRARLSGGMRNARSAPER